MDEPLFMRFLRFLYLRLAPAEGWLSVAGLYIALMAVAAGIEQARWTPGAPPVYTLAGLAGLCGLLLTRIVRRGWIATVLLILLGLLVCTLSAARAWPTLVVWWDNLSFGLTWLRDRRAEMAGIPIGLWVADHLGRWQGVMTAWWQAATAGQRAPSKEPLAFFLYLAVWAVSAWAGWAAFRRHRALVALVPAGVLLAANIYYAFRGAQWLLLLMAGLLLLAIALRQFTLQEQWRREGVDYSAEISIEASLYGLLLAVGVLMAMPLLPNIDLAAVAKDIRQAIRGPTSVAEEKVQTLFPALDRPRPEAATRPTAQMGGLPRSHLLGSGPELARRPVMRVRTSDPDPAANQANYRWRAFTYSIYTGRGWENPETAAAERFSAGEVWMASLPAARRPLRQIVDFETTGAGSLIYAAGEAISTDHPYIAYLRQPDDAIGLEAEVRNYIAVSQIPDVSEQQLRASPPPPTGTISAAYFELPLTVPDRVHELAQTITTGAATGYDQARMLEAFLRQFPYDLDISEPPPGIDVADYFLFDLQRGYCDYYATAFVVMARSLGLPARLAIGYAAGDYDRITNSFVVNEAQAHSWPEVYFAAPAGGSYGWIPFEPTASQPTFVYAPVGGDNEQVIASSELNAELAGLRRRAWLSGIVRWSLPLLAVLVIALLAAMARREWRLRRQAANPWQLAYLRLESWGWRLGVFPAAWLTPREYANRWQSRLHDRPDAAPLVAQIGALGEAVERRAFAPPDRRPSDLQAMPAWRRLRRLLWRQRLRR